MKLKYTITDENPDENLIYHDCDVKFNLSKPINLLPGWQRVDRKYNLLNFVPYLIAMYVTVLALRYLLLSLKDIKSLLFDKTPTWHISSKESKVAESISDGLKKENWA